MSQNYWAIQSLAFLQDIGRCRIGSDNPSPSEVQAMEEVTLSHQTKLLKHPQGAQFMRMDRLTLILAAVLLAFTVEASDRDLYEVKIKNNVTMKTRDGVTLSADVYSPKADGKFPIILERTPYDKRGGVGLGLKAAAQGYVYIVQDVRGRNASEGDW